MEGAGSQVKTDVDSLVSLVKERGKISIEEVAKKLGKSLSVVQTWVDFLVEEGILGIEYKFVTPYLYFNKDVKQNPSVLKGPEGDKLEDKNIFFEKAKSKGLSNEKVNALWKSYLENNLDIIKEHFLRRASAKNFSGVQMDKLWSKYYDYLIKEE